VRRRYAAAFQAAAILLVILACPAPARATEVHGASEAFAAPGIVLAWGVLRGADEASTRVVLRIAADAGYGSVSVVGIDPFTHASQPLLESGSGAIVVAAARAHFAQFPRTEVRLFRTRDRASSAEPDLVVYYLGVPDTTPEFDDPAKLDAYLDDRLQRLRSMPGRSP
jgi:hypothetical protein